MLEFLCLKYFSDIIFYLVVDFFSSTAFSVTDKIFIMWLLLCLVFWRQPLISNSSSFYPLEITCAIKLVDLQKSLTFFKRKKKSFYIKNKRKLDLNNSTSYTIVVELRLGESGETCSGGTSSVGKLHHIHIRDCF